MPIPNSVNPSTTGYSQSGLLASFDAVRPAFKTTLFQNFGDQFQKDMRFLWDLNAKRPIANVAGGFHFEEDRFDTAVTVKANASTTGSTLIFTLADAEIQTFNGARTSYPQINDFLIDPVNRKRYQITNKVDNGTDTTITAIETNGQAATTPVPGKKYGIYSSGSVENSGHDGAKNSYWTKQTFKLQNIKTQGLITGYAAVNELFPEYDQEGNFIGNWVGWTRMRTEWEHLKKLAGAMVFGKENSAGASQTNGMLEVFSTRANTLDISGGVDLDSLKDTVDLLKANSTPSNVMGLLCHGVNRPLQEALAVTKQDVNIASVREQSAALIFGRKESSMGLMATYDFNTVIVEGFTYNLRLFDLSYDPNLFGLGGTAGNYFVNTAYFMPSQGGVDAQGIARRHMEMSYASNPAGGVDRLMKVYDLGANAAIPTNDRDNLTTQFESHIGMDYFAMKQCAFWFDSSIA